MDRLASLGLVLVAGLSLATSARAEEKAFSFGPEETVKAKGSEIVVPGYAVPSLEDWNNDRLKDLIIGEGGGTAPGKIRVYLNRGTESNPRFEDYFYVKSGAHDLICTPGNSLGCFPRFVRWDADSRKDLLVGQGDGTIQVFLNKGTDSEPEFDFGSEVVVGLEHPADTLNVGGGATPLLLDWNGDSMPDIVAGGDDGAIHFYNNCGCGGWIPPHFDYSPVEGKLVRNNGTDLLVPTGCSSPVVVDWDGDGKKDMLVGNAAGQVLYYRNIWTDMAPAFSEPVAVQSNGRPIDLPGSLCSRPFLCHWTSTDRWDLLVGYGDGRIRLYRSVSKVGDFNGNGLLDSDDLTFLVKALHRPVPAGGSPADLNGDRVVDDLDLRLFADLWLAEHGTELK